MDMNLKSYLSSSNYKNKEIVSVKAEGNDSIGGEKTQRRNLNTAVINKDNVENEKNNNGNDTVSSNGFTYSDNKEEQIEEAIEILNKLLSKRNSRVEVGFHDFFKSDIMLKIVDEVTGDVLVEVPPKKILDMIATMVKMAEGIVIDKKA